MHDPYTVAFEIRRPWPKRSCEECDDTGHRRVEDPIPASTV